MKWLLIVMVLNIDTDEWETSRSQPPVMFPNHKSNNAILPEEECKQWANSIREGWKRVDFGNGRKFIYSVSCSEVLDNGK